MTLTEMRAILKARDLHLTKSLGQNFLHDAGVIDRILRSIYAKPEDRLLEIGPGTGSFAAESLEIFARLGTPLERYALLDTSADMRARQRERLLASPAAQSTDCTWLDGWPQPFTGVVFGNELLDAHAKGEAPDAALKRLLAADSGFQSRQIGVIAMDGRSAQHTGTGPNAWAGHRAGKNYVTQGNILVGPEVVEAVAKSFEASEGNPRHLADRLIDAIHAGFVLGGDKRHGLRTSAAVVVADPRPGMSRRTDGQTVNINVCENADPVGELRRIYDAVSQTLGYRTLEQFSGGDIYQLKVMLNALGFYKKGETVAPPGGRGGDANVYTAETVAAVDAFRASEKMGTPQVGGSPAGLVDAETVARLWAALERAGKANDVRKALLDVTMIRR